MAYPIETIWEKILERLQDNLSRPGMESIRALVYPLSLDEKFLTIAVPDQFSHGWIGEKCGPLINQVLVENLGPGYSFKIEVLPEKENPEEKTEDKIPGQKPAGLTAYLNPKYTFDNFVVGPSNRFAHAAAFAVSEAPAKAYNPLFIYGGVGLGKTHLIQAIGHKVQNKNPAAKITYVTSEKFTNDFIDSVKHGEMQGFRNRYRHCDILLLDDLQFLVGKEQTQVEFFHTFNTLYEDSKQIIITSDKPPQDISSLEERLRSRFEWGLITDIQPPELEVRVAILKKKVEKDRLGIPDDVLYFIAAQVPSNIRKLEGALTSVVARSSLMKNELSVEYAEKILKDFLTPKNNKTVTINLIKKTVADFYGLRIEDLSAKTRTQEIALARQVSMYLARELTSTSLPRIGENFGGRDHSTVLHAYDKIKDLVKNEPEISEVIKNLTSKILSS
jgi:chromosomal replication initiator protein